MTRISMMHDSPHSDALGGAALLEPSAQAVAVEARSGAAAQPLTICHPVWQLGRGGLERQLVQVIGRLGAERFRHIVLVRGCEKDHWLSQSPLADHVTLIQEPLRKKDRLWSLRLASILDNHAVDVLHVRGLRMLPDAVVAARLAGSVKVAFSFHGFEWPDAGLGRWRRRMLRTAALHCDDRWAVSRQAGLAIAERLNIAAERFGVVSNGVDTEQFCPSLNRDGLRQSLNLPSDRLVVLCVGNLKPIKGHDVLLKALAEMDEAAEKITTVLVGRDETEGALPDWAQRHLPKHDIRFVGSQREVLRWHQAADLFVLPSHSEGMSNALLEAMACGTPAVATAVGGNRDVIDHGNTGLLVHPDSPMEMAAAMSWLIKDEAARKGLGHAGRLHVQNRFNVALTAAACGRRYQQLCGIEAEAAEMD